MSKKENRQFKMVKRVETKEDGRFIIYYDFENSDVEPSANANDAVKKADTKGSKD